MAHVVLGRSEVPRNVDPKPASSSRTYPVLVPARAIETTLGVRPATMAVRPNPDPLGSFDINELRVTAGR